jgi:membrane protease YdiL (CAAX protease family)
VERAWSAFVAGPSYPATAEDRRTVRIFGLELPLRATVAIVAVTLILLFDFSRTAIPEEVQDLGRSAAALRYQAVTRIVLFLLVPVLIVVFAFRDRPREYGLRLGSWRWGLGLALIGCVVMTPIVLAVGSNPDFRSFYSISSASTVDLALTNTIDLIPTEFLFRGFLMFTLLRAIGPLGLIVAQLPFVFAHLGKPEIELFSTLFGGSVFGWLDWRTRSILWSALAHVYILTLVVVVASSG